jgi:hypothetical protein
MVISMNDRTDTDHTQVQDDILTYDVSDEALEACGMARASTSYESCRIGPGGNCH